MPLACAIAHREDRPASGFVDAATPRHLRIPWCAATHMGLGPVDIGHPSSGIELAQLVLVAGQLPDVFLGIGWSACLLPPGTSIDHWTMPPPGSRPPDTGGGTPRSAQARARHALWRARNPYWHRTRGHRMVPVREAPLRRRTTERGRIDAFGDDGPAQDVLLVALNVIADLQANRTANQQEAARLHACGMSRGEIADHLSITRSAVTQRLQRGQHDRELELHRSIERIGRTLLGACPAPGATAAGWCPCAGPAAPKSDCANGSGWPVHVDAGRLLAMPPGQPTR